MQASRFWASPHDQKKELLRQKGIQRKTTLGCMSGLLSPGPDLAVEPWGSQPNIARVSLGENM